MKNDDFHNIEIEKLAKRIRSLRKKLGYKDYDTFAYDHGISRAQYGRYEKGQNLRYTSLIRVINALGVSVQEFFSEGFD